MKCKILKSWGNVAALAVFTFASLGFLHAPSKAVADPNLQLYLEGATYSIETESWVISPSGSSSNDPFRLWVIGNIEGSGGKGPIDNVRLAVAYAAGGPTPTITLTPSQTNGFGGWVDPTLPDAAPYIQTVTDGSSPVLSNGKSLPSHGIYGEGTVWQEFYIGLLDETTSSTSDIIDTFPENPDKLGGHINVYEISISGGSGLTLHFDLYDSIVANGHAIFAPFSHDAEIVPAPGAALLAMFGLSAVGWVRRRVS